MSDEDGGERKEDRKKAHTAVWVSSETADRLWIRRKRGETYDSVIRRLLDDAEQREKEVKGEE